MRLLEASPDEIEKIVEEYNNEVREIEKSVIEVCYFMRGGITWSEVWNLTFSNLKNIKSQIKKYIEILSKSNLNIL